MSTLPIYVSTKAGVTHTHPPLVNELKNMLRNAKSVVELAHGYSQSECSPNIHPSKTRIITTFSQARKFTGSTVLERAQHKSNG